MGLCVDIRLNDKVRYISPAQPDYEQAVSDLVRANHWIAGGYGRGYPAGAEGFMNHGMSRQEAESYYSGKEKLPPSSTETETIFPSSRRWGCWISYGYKP